MDVPVIISDKFLLFMSYENLEVPQLQFIDRVWTFPLCSSDVYPQCKLCRRPARSYRCCSLTVPPPGIGGVGFGPSPNLDTKHTIYELCLPSERGFGMSMDLADPVSSGKFSGTFVFTAPVAEPTVMSFTVPLTGCTIVATATVVTTCSSSADCPDSSAPMCCGVFASRCRVVVEVSLLMVLTILFGTA